MLSVCAVAVKLTKNNTANTEGDGSNATDQTIPSEGMPAETDTTSTQMDTTSTNGTSGAAGASGTQESGNENGTGSTGSGSR